MFEFLFDIKPDAGNVCPTTRLAYLISERGNKVYYTDTSDSVSLPVAAERNRTHHLST